MKISTPYQHPDSGIYYYRRAVPLALKNTLGKTMIKVSLKTRSPSLAIKRFMTVHSTCESLFEGARQGQVIETYWQELVVVDEMDKSKTKLTLSILLDKFNLERNATHKSMDESRLVVKRFNHIYPDMNANAISGVHIREFKSSLLKYLSDSSVNKHLSVISSILNWANQNSYLISNWHNPVTGKNIKIKSSKKTRLPFSRDDLRKIFTSPIYLNQSRPRGGAGEAAYWMPIIALYTGMRLEEIGQLRCEDIKTEGSINYFDVNNEGSHHLKNISSIRQIPIHSKLIALGFLDYVLTQKGYVFPDLKVNQYQRRTQVWSKWFNRYLRKIGVMDSRKVFHSTRHNFKDALREVDVDEALSDALTGHSHKSVGRQYGKGYSISRKYETINLINYSVLDLAKIY